MKNASGSIFTIEQVNADGRIFLSSSNKSTTLTKSKIEVFLQKYSITTTMHEMLELKGALFDEHPDITEIVSKSVIFLNSQILKATTLAISAATSAFSPTTEPFSDPST